MICSRLEIWLSVREKEDADDAEELEGRATKDSKRPRSDPGIRVHKLLWGVEEEKETPFKRERIIFEEGNMEAVFYSRGKVSVGPVSFLLCHALHMWVYNDIVRIAVRIKNKCRHLFFP